MSTSVLQSKYVFGYHTGVAQNAVFLNSTTVAYAAGYQIVFNDTATREQKFVSSFVPAGDNHFEGITCIALSPNRKLLAVAERSEKPEINIFDTKNRRKKKNLIHVEAIAKSSFVSMEFSYNNENLVCLTGRPDYSVAVFKCVKGKLLYSVRLADTIAGPGYDLFTKLSMNPLDSETSVVMGPKELRFYRLTEDRLQPMVTPTDQLLKSKASSSSSFSSSSSAQLGGGGPVLTCMAWLREPADCVVVGNSEGRLALYANGEFCTFLAVALPPGVSASALLSLSSGLVVGCSDGGIRFLEVKLPELGDALKPDAHLFTLVHAWHHEVKFTSPSSSALVAGGANGGGGVGAGGGGGGGMSSGDSVDSQSSSSSSGGGGSGGSARLRQGVVHMAMAQGEERIAVSYADGQLRHFPVSGTPAKVSGSDLKPVATSFHQPGVLTGLDVCVRKPLVVTSSLDRTVRVWNYEECTLELSKSWVVDPLSVACHPSGLHIAVGFGDKLRLLHVLMEDLKVYRELPVKSCRECRFSKGGHFLAAVNQANVVLVFDFYTGEKMVELRGHSGKVKSLTWGPHDATIVSCGVDGAVYCWDWEGGKRLGESVTKGTHYFCALTASTSSSYAAAAEAEDGSGGVLVGGGGGSGPASPMLGGGNSASAKGGGAEAGGGGGGANSASLPPTSIYTVGSDHVVKELDVPELQVVKTHDTRVPLSQALVNSTQSLFFVGTGFENMPLGGGGGGGVEPRASFIAGGAAAKAGSVRGSFVGGSSGDSGGASGSIDRGGGGGGGLVAQGARPGMIRVYSFPLTAEYSEFSCLSLPVSKLRLTHDDARLVAADESGCIVVMEVKAERDKGKSKGALGGAGGGGMLAGGAGTPVPGGMRWAEEILITKSDLAERQQQIAELKGKVEELQLHNEYQLRLRDMSQTEKVKEVMEKFAQDVEQDKNKYELLKEEKNDMAMEYEERLRQVESAHVVALEEEEASYQDAIMKEVDEYQRLIAERNAQMERWEEQRGTMVNTHARFMREVADEFEQKLEEDKVLKGSMANEKFEKVKEFAEEEGQLEDDVDTEIENIRDRYDAQLSSERELTLRFKGENGIMKKKFAVLEKTIEEKKEELKACGERADEVRVAIRRLEAEVKRLKREIRQRDGTIGEREKRIYDLKKKNQELEKFKFVLDFKIKELKRQIEPREAEIGNMKRQIKAMDHELERYHKSNAMMDVLIGELRTKLDGMQHNVTSQRSALKQSRLLEAGFKADVAEAIGHLQNPEKLRQACGSLLEKHVTGPREQQVQLQLALTQHGKINGGGGGGGANKAAAAAATAAAAAAAAAAANAAGGVKELEGNVVAEYGLHKQYLEKTFAALKEKFAGDVGAARERKTQAMRDNMALIRDINASREGNRAAKQAIQTRLAAMQRLRVATKQGKLPSQRRNGGGGLGGGGCGGCDSEGTYIGAAGGGGGGAGPDEAALQEMASNREQISHLRQLVASLESKLEPMPQQQQLQHGGQQSGSRPVSRGEVVLPPVGGAAPF